MNSAPESYSLGWSLFAAAIGIALILHARWRDRCEARDALHRRALERLGEPVWEFSERERR